MVQTTAKNILSSTGKFGMKAIMLFILILFIFVNINLISYACSFYFFKSLETTPYVLWTSVILVIGVAFTVFACYKTYQYLMIDAISVAYQHATPLIDKTCAFVINNVSDISTNKLKIKSSHIEKIINVNDSIGNTYNSQTPKAVKRMISFLINRIPFASLLGNIKDSIKSQDREETIKSLHQQVDIYAGSMFKESNMKWTAWLIPLNIIIQIVAISLIR